MHMQIYLYFNMHFKFIYFQLEIRTLSMAFQEGRGDEIQPMRRQQARTCTNSSNGLISSFSYFFIFTFYFVQSEAVIGWERHKDRIYSYVQPPAVDKKLEHC